MGCVNSRQHGNGTDGTDGTAAHCEEKQKDSDESKQETKVQRNCDGNDHSDILISREASTNDMLQPETLHTTEPSYLTEVSLIPPPPPPPPLLQNANSRLDFSKLLQKNQQQKPKFSPVRWQSSFSS